MPLDPVSLVVAALATGASAALSDTVKTAVGDAYGALKNRIKNRYSSVALEPLEEKPSSEIQRAAVAENLTDAGADADTELVALAKALLEAVRSEAPQAAAAVGIDLEEVRAEYLKVGSIDAEGTGVKVRKGDFSGGIDIGDVRAGDSRHGYMEGAAFRRGKALGGESNPTPAPQEDPDVATEKQEGGENPR